MSDNRTGEYEERLLTYLKKLAGNEWGRPEGFGGRVCFQAIPALELERRGCPGGRFDWEWTDYSLTLLRERKDCQDFSMVGLLRMLYRYPASSLLTQGYREEIEKVLLAAKYDEQDPGKDTCCWHTENHQVQYASSELLLGELFPDTVFGNTGRIGRWHRERAREKLYRWLDWRRRFSFSEWNSSCYYDEDGAALLNLAEYSRDPELRSQAEEVLELMVRHVALNSWQGITGASQGRAYLAQQIEPDETPMATLAQMSWGRGEVPSRLSLTALLFAAGEIRIPAEVLAIGRDCPAELENRERHSLDAEEGAEFGMAPDRFCHYPFYMGAGQDHHHLVSDMRYIHHNGQEKWPGFFADREYYEGCKARREDFLTWCLPHALGHADLYTFRTPEYMLGCAQDYHPGAPGYQQLIWSATLGRRAVVFTTNPTPADIPYGRPGPWVGNGVLPKVVQHRNVLIALYRVRPCPIYDQPPWYREDRVHAWFPRGAFDEIVEENGWCFGRKEGGFIALRPLANAFWAAPEPGLAARVGSMEPYEWVVEETDVAWVCELGSARSHGSFSAFVSALSKTHLTGGVDHLVFDSPSLGRIETGWKRELTVAGESIPVHDYPLLSNPYGVIPFNRR